MGDLANMTSVHGEVSGPRLLRWLRSREAMERADANGCKEMRCLSRQQWYAARADLLKEMADDLEAELTPPDYPEDEDDTVNLDDPALTGRPE